LHDFNGEQLVQKLAREPGKRESRYVHLFTDMDTNLPVDNSVDVQSNKPRVHDDSDLAERVEVLERQVADLIKKLADLA
jgi:uncharacterized protein YceH (UPF0502 family)